MAIWDAIFPAGTFVNYGDDEDFYYAMLNDAYVKRIWDAVGLIMAGLLGFGAYSGYQFTVESYATIVNQVWLINFTK